MADWIVDACCLINLYASGKPESILASCAGEFCVSPEVLRESLSIRRPDADDPALLVSAPIELSGAISAGLIKECRLEEDIEIEAFVEFAAQVDDGEASCLAIARSRKWVIATDDRKAIRLAAEAGVALVTTPELLQKWGEATRPGDEILAEALQNIELFARFRPRRSDPLYDWWTSLSERE